MRNGTASTRNFMLTCTAIAAAGLLTVGGSALASDEAGTIKTLKGTASVERDGQQTPAALGGKVMVSDRIQTGPESSIGITLRDNTLLSAGASSTLVLNRFAFDSTTHAGALGIAHQLHRRLVFHQTIAIQPDHTSDDRQGHGLYRISELRHQQLWDQHLARDPDLASLVRGLASQHAFLAAPHLELTVNLRYATAIAWLLVEREQPNLPEPDDLHGMARIWRQVFQPQGRLRDFLQAWQHCVREPYQAA